MLSAAAAVAAFAAAILILVASLPGEAELRAVEDSSQATTIYDFADRPVFTIFKEYRIEVPLERMSPHLRQAIIAIEDQRFFDHDGVDLVRIAGAALANIKAGRPAQGGSTITQQLAREAFLSKKKTLLRKLKEAALAARLERMYSKDQILELYLNRIYFGDGLYGAEAAARGYFGKSAADLSLVESATLAGLVQAPSLNAPTVSPARATARRDLVLAAMLANQTISREAWSAATSQRIELRDNLRRTEPLGQHFKEEIRQQLVQQLGWTRVSEGGLRVYTTIDPGMQRMAEAAVAESLKQIDSRRAGRTGKPDRTPATGTDQLEAALVALDPSTGEVRAMVGGRDFSNSRFNRAVQARRQPGSAFKPFVYSAALEAGYTPASLVERLNEPIRTPQGAWIPDDDHSTATEMTIRTALRTSSNRAAVRMLSEVGLPKTVENVRRLGMETVPSVPSLALGSGEVTLLTMTSAYAAFANRGIVHRPVLIRRVEDRDGATIFEHAPKPTQALSPTTAFLMASMLADVVDAGTAYRARQAGFTLPAAGKTGTTNDFVDAWFVGFTPNLVAGVWIGFDQPKTILRNGFAGDLAVPLWARFMKGATANDKPEFFKPPAGTVAVAVCLLSGRRPNNGCDHVTVVSDNGNVSTKSLVYTEYFARGTEPSEVCPLHPGLPAGTLLAAASGADTAVPGVHPEPVGRTLDMGAPPLTAIGPVASVEPVPPEPPKKKRSFWSRVFGLGKSDKDRSQTETTPPDP
jgi:1A family penicillin-binding protein